MAAKNEKLKLQGEDGEAQFKAWLDSVGRSYLHVNQSPEMFAKLFAGVIKRPDFLVLLDSIGLIAVDVKNRKLSGGVYTLDKNEELAPTLAFERIFRIPVWYAFLQRRGTEIEWYWISAHRAVEVAEIRQAGKSKEFFLAIKQDQFACLRIAENFGKLLEQTTPKVSRLADDAFDF